MTTSVGWKKTIVYSLLPLVVLLAALEGGARIIEIWLPPWKVDYGWGFVPGGSLFIESPEHEGMMIRNPSKTSFQPEEFPAVKPGNGFRVFMVGESSVFQLFDNLKDLARRLNVIYQGRYQFECIDAGAGAFGSHRLAPVVAELLEHQPDLMLIYMGHNEFCEADHAKLAQLDRLPLQKILYRSAFCRFVRDRLAATQLSQYQRAKNQNILGTGEADWRSGNGVTYTSEQIRERMDTFRNNYRIMIELCQTKGVPVIMGSVPSNLWLPDLLDKKEMLNTIQTLYTQGRYEEGKKLAQEILSTSKRYQASDSENAITRDLARQYGVPLADVEAAVTAAEPHGVPGETLFTDRCHLNDLGKNVLIKVYEREIMKLLREKGMNPGLN